MRSARRASWRVWTCSSSRSRRRPSYTFWDDGSLGASCCACSLADCRSSATSPTIRVCSTSRSSLRSSSLGRRVAGRRSSTRCWSRISRCVPRWVGSCSAPCLLRRSATTRMDALRLPRPNCGCWRGFRRRWMRSTNTGRAIRRNACRRCRSTFGRRSSPPATTCRRTSTGSVAATWRRPTSGTSASCRSSSAAPAPPVGCSSRRRICTFWSR